VGAAQFWAVRKGFFFTGAGAELPVVWSAMLVTQILLGDGPFAVIASISGAKLQAGPQG
jgi:putative oxidoreductase